MDIEPHKINRSLRSFYDSALAGEDELEEASIVTELDGIEERYSADEKIAEGGMKKIIKTHDSITGRTVAKGIIKCKTTNEQLDKFVDEVRITAGLEHPNIIPVYDLGLTGDKEPFFTMKLVEGDDLKQTLDKINQGGDELSKFYNQSRMLEIFLKVCDAVEYAHSKKIVHLDIKPANIQVGQFGEVLLCDWGLARQLQDGGVPEEYSSEKSVPDSLELSLDGKIKGSPGYMAPEQVSDKFGLRSVRTDIYSLGALLYTLILGHAPIEEKALDETLRRTLTGDLKPIPEDIPEGLSAVIKKALNTEPVDRYQSVNKLSEDIRSYVSGYATQAENAGMVKQLKLMVKRHRAVSFLSSFFVILTVILSSYFVIKVNKEKEQLIVEQKRTLEARQKASQYMVHNSTHKYHNRLFDETTNLAIQAAALDPNNEKAWEYLGYFYLGELNADKALESLDNADTEISRWLTKKAEYLKSLTHESKKVSIENAITFRKHMEKSDPNFRKAVSWHVNFTVTRKYSLDERIHYTELIISESLDKEIKVVNEDGKYSLDLSGKKRFRDLEVLSQLPLTKLNLSGAILKDLTQISDMPLEELDISNSSLDTLKGIEKMPLKILNITDSKVRGLHYTPETLEVIESGKNLHHLRHLTKLPNVKKVIIPRNFYNDRMINEVKAEIVYKD